MVEQLSTFDTAIEQQEPAPTPRRKIDVGETVKMKFYADELEYVQQHQPELLTDGEVIDKRLDFFIVRFGEQEHAVERGKLKLI